MREVILIRTYIDATDMRMEYLYNVLSDCGLSPKKLNDDLIDDAHIRIVSPSVTPDELMSHINSMNSYSVLVGGQASEKVFVAAKNRNIRYININSDEAFATRNALPTAEGALMIIMQNTEKVVCGMNVGITGFGRISRVLAPMLKNMGATVHVFTDNPISAAWSNNSHMLTYNLTEMQNVFAQCDVIVNTVPKRIISNDCIDSIPRNTLIIELASNPYGFDVKYAVEAEKKVIHAPGLPGKSAPYSAAVYLAEAVIRNLESEEFYVT